MVGISSRRALFVFLFFFFLVSVFVVHIINPLILILSYPKRLYRHPRITCSVNLLRMHNYHRSILHLLDIETSTLFASTERIKQAGIVGSLQRKTASEPYHHNFELTSIPGLCQGGSKSTMA